MFRMRRRQEPENVSCSSCGAAMIPIIYGMPGDAIMDRAQRGEVLLGGCVSRPSQPTWHCKPCGDQAST